MSNKDQEKISQVDEKLDKNQENQDRELSLEDLDSLAGGLPGQSESESSSRNNKPN